MNSSFLSFRNAPKSLIFVRCGAVRPQAAFALSPRPQRPFKISVTPVCGVVHSPSHSWHRPGFGSANQAFADSEVSDSRMKDWLSPQSRVFSE